MFKQRRLCAMSIAPPLILAITPPTYPSVYLREGVAFVVTGIRFKAAQGTGKLYWASSPSFAGATVVECSTIGAWADAQITATMPAVGAVGNTGFLIVVNDDGLASAGKAATALSLLINWTYGAGSQPAGITLAGEGAVSYGGDMLNAYDNDNTDGLSVGSQAKAYCDPFAGKTIAYMETSIDLSPIIVLDSEGFDMSRLRGAGDEMASFRAHTKNGANISVLGKLKNGAGTSVLGDDVVIATASAHTFRALWQVVGDTGTIKEWVDATPLTFPIVGATWTGSGFTGQTITYIEVGLAYNQDGHLVGLSGFPGVDDSLILLEDNTKVWGA